MIRTTLDIDFYKIKRYHITLNQIIKKIIMCPFVNSIEVKYSASMNGIHIILWCEITYPCCKCRLVFDDAARFSYDQRRKPHTQNVLFDGYRKRGLEL